MSIAIQVVDERMAKCQFLINAGR